MRGSHKSAPPQSFIAWLNQRNENWLPTYASLQNPEKLELVEKILDDQNGVCVYCGVKISQQDYAENRCHIEHFRPQQKYPQHELTFENMFLSCGHKDANGASVNTCGPVKENWFDEDLHVYPAEVGCAERFFYDLTGCVLASEQDHNAKNMIEVLNLDAEELKAERKEIISEIEYYLLVYKDEKLLQTEIKAMKEIWASCDDNKSQKSFAHVAIRYLDEY